MYQQRNLTITIQKTPFLKKNTPCGHWIRINLKFPRVYRTSFRSRKSPAVSICLNALREESVSYMHENRDAIIRVVLGILSSDLAQVQQIGAKEQRIPVFREQFLDKIKHSSGGGNFVLLTSSFESFRYI